MEWKQPKIGTSRVVRKFLWWPRCINRETKWLQVARFVQVFRPATGMDADLPNRLGEWVDEYWSKGHLGKGERNLQCWMS